MSKAKTKAPMAEAQEQVATEQPEQVVTGDSTGQALPEVEAQPEAQVAAAVQQPEPVAMPSANTDPEPDALIDAFVLCDGSLDGITRYRAGSVLQGVPESLAEANAHWLDTNSTAVEHALNSGAEVFDYEQET
ncbi:MAG: hypothetical protein ITG01_11785 [Comamonas sp.]|nr:hypothetical protein [Comamonas sp.]